ncbi:uncharacterized protein TNCT_93351 [Trichonephila clavata]|uniref:Armadillo repeat-containing domain-containing protein n=1 Tax=Trichonephila clavata TaxID=2740835 RepID=A0A8X6FV60_TRICU|nr:uncharacterized protein TNCT_93351 [Trichonephila clavata]
MASEDRFFVEKIAFCSVLCAGFAYAGYSIVTKICFKETKKKDSKFSQANLMKLLKTEATQTEELMKIRSMIDDRCISPKSVRERVNDLNLSERLRKNSIPVSPEVKPHSFHGSPWSSPLGCAKYLSVSCENISTRQCPSPDFKEKSKFATSQGTLEVELQSKLSKLKLSESISQQMLPFQEDVITLKTLSNLQKTPEKMTTFEVKNLVHLLQSVNEEIVVKTLYTISNCAAFTANQELLCDSECPKYLRELLLNHSEPIKIAVTQAISNISVIDGSHRYFQSHIPIILTNAINGRELLKSLSLSALSNLALDSASHKYILKHVHHISLMARNGTTVVQLQALRLLVNLSCNKDIIPLLLMSEVPSDMLDMLRKPHERELVLRLLTFLANIATFATHFVDGSSKPTLLSVLYHFNKTTELSDLAILINDQDEDLSFQAKRLHDALLRIS